jgi:hypothetical protein
MPIWTPWKTPPKKKKKRKKKKKTIDFPDWVAVLIVSVHCRPLPTSKACVVGLCRADLSMVSPKQKGPLASEGFSLARISDREGPPTPLPTTLWISFGDKGNLVHDDDDVIRGPPWFWRHVQYLDRLLELEVTGSPGKACWWQGANPSLSFCTRLESGL